MNNGPMDRVDHEENGIEQFFLDIFWKNEENKSLTKGELQFLIDIADMTPSAEWGWEVFQKFEKGEYN